MNQVFDYFRKLFSTADWPARWHCGNWSEFEGWLYIISDLMIWAAYFAIPLIILRYVIRKNSTIYTRLYYLFAAFILACGSTHFIDAMMFWIPIYRFNSLLKFVTAIISWVTVIALIKYLPSAFATKTIPELEAEIHRRKVAEEALRKLNEELEYIIEEKTKEIRLTELKFKSIIENSADAISLMDEKLQGIYSNKSAYELSGRSEEESKEVHWSTLVHPDDINKINETVAKAIKTPGKQIGAEIRLLHRERGYVHIEGTICNLLENTAVHALVFNFRDVSKIKNAEQEVWQLNESLERKIAERTAQLEAANKELEGFSYSVSHDLRAPLRIINGYADMLYADYKKELNGEGIRLLDIIMYNTRHMGKLIDALLNLARMGRKELTVQHADISAIVMSTIKEQISLQTRSVTFDTDELIAVNCDSVLVRHVWSNLISNAIKYSSKVEHPMITIKSTENEHEVTYSVKDNGVGFDMKYSHKLFGVFQRLHNKTDFDGTGVGLALVQRIVTKHGGKVWAEGEENVGATFYFSIPKTIEHEQQQY
jgi:PAS domain S-box-containing protein